MERYKVRLHMEGIGTWDASVDGKNRWRLPKDAAEDKETRTAMAEAIADTVEIHLSSYPPIYMPVYDMRYAIQSLTAFPGSEPDFELPFVEGRVY